ncbi:MAG: hypothetical protein WA761_09385 [Thermoplasmata archaeon]
MNASVPHDRPHAGHPKTPISVPFVILSALLCGIGIFFIIYWLVTFYFIWFSGVFIVLAGGLLFFSERTGLQESRA